MGVTQIKSKMAINQKYIAREMRASSLARYVIVGETWLNDFGGLSASYFSDIHFERLADGYTIECRLGIIFVTWCIAKLNCHVNFCHTCLLII